MVGSGCFSLVDRVGRRRIVGYYLGIMFTVILLSLMGIWVTVSDRRQHRIPIGGLRLAGAGFLLWHIATGDLVQSLIGGSVMALMAVLLTLWTSIGGGDLKYAIVLGIALGSVDASVTWVLATIAVFAWRGLQWIRRPMPSRSPVIWGPWLAATSVAVAICVRWPGHSP